MDPVSNVDRLVVLLRQRLLERSRTAAGRGDRKARPEQQQATGMDNVQALAAIDGVDERQLRRSLIQSILADQLGGQLLNEAKFQQVVDRVTDTLDSDPASAKLMTRMVQELRASPR